MRKITCIILIGILFSFIYANSEPVHFQKVWTGNGIDHMQFNVYIGYLGDVPFGEGDEIAVFDGEYCVGAVRLTQDIDVNTEASWAYFVASRNDADPGQPQTGYVVGNQISYRVWISATGTEYSGDDLNVDLTWGSSVFSVGVANWLEMQIEQPQEVDSSVLFDSNSPGDVITTNANLLFPTREDVVYRANNWQANLTYWQVEFSSEDVISDITLTATLRRQYESSGPPLFTNYRGPEWWYLNYSLDGGTSWELSTWDEYIQFPDSNWQTWEYVLPTSSMRTENNIVVRWTSGLDPEANNGWAEIKNVVATGDKVTEDDQPEPDAQDETIVPPNTDQMVHFPNTGVDIAFLPGNPAQTITIQRFNTQPAGDLPAGILYVSHVYWNITSTNPTPGEYYIVFDVTNVAGINDPTTLHLLKRENSNEEWTDLGIPYEVDMPEITWGPFDSFSEFAFGGDENNTLPVELSSFTANVTANMFVELQWVAETETNMLGYNIYKSISKELTEAVRANFVIIPANNSSTVTYYSFIDENVDNGMMFYYWLQSNDLDLTFEFHGPISVEVEQQTDPGTTPGVELKTELIGAYPNPFNPSTNIAFTLAQPANVSINVYNISGQFIKTLLFDQPFAKGYHSIAWDGRDTSGRQAASGIYFYRMETDVADTMIKKMLLLK